MAFHTIRKFRYKRHSNVRYCYVLDIEIIESSNQVSLKFNRQRVLTMKQPTEVRILYPRQIAYRLGDFEGSTVDRLCSKHDAEIYVSECVGLYGCISIVATTKKIFKVLSELVWMFKGVLRLTAGEFDERKIRKSSSCINIKLLLDHDGHGSVDHLLKKIGRRSKTKIVSYTVDYPMCFGRVVDITGTPADCAKGITKLTRKMKSLFAGVKTEDVHRFDTEGDPFSFLENTVDKYESNANGGNPNTVFQCDYRLDEFDTATEKNVQNLRVGLDEVVKNNAAIKRKIDEYVNDEHDNDADGVATNKKCKYE